MKSNLAELKRTSHSERRVSGEAVAAQREQPSNMRRLVFRLFAIAGIPLLLLLLTEGILRLAGYGYDPGFFRASTVEGRRVWIENRDFGRRFFPPGLVRAAQPFTLPADKTPGTLRVFVLGESAAMGDPDFKFGLPRMLAALLRERYPGRRIEVINTGIVAINSHVIVPLARDCARHQADLWVIYMGNNEVVGPFGSASIFGARAPALGLVRAGLWLKTTRLGQLLDSWGQWLRQGGAPPAEWNGMEMMTDEKISREAAATARVYWNFERNLKDILTSGVRAGVPIILCTVPSNLKDCAPFASLHRPGLGAAELDGFQSACREAKAYEGRGEPAKALEAYQRAAQLDSHFAELAFRQGQCAQRLGRNTEAAAFFARARDEDALQFRADSTINETIRRAAAAFAGQQVCLVDAERIFATNSPGGLAGAEYFYEHVHLRPAGNYLLARVIAEQAGHSLALAAGGPELTEVQCYEALGLTDWNRYEALNIILDRIQREPFPQQLNHSNQVERLTEEMSAYRQATKPAQVRRQAEQVAKLVAGRPDDPDLRWNLAGLLEIAGDPAGEEEQWRAVLRLQPQSILAWYNLANLLESRRPAEALESYTRCLQLDPKYYPARYALGTLWLQQGRLAQAIADLKRAVQQKPNSIEARLALGQTYARAGRKADAGRQWAEVLKLDPLNATARERQANPNAQP